ncbi:MAG: cobalamin-dependent protein [Tissierellales bacterium]|nr:cobalamin-dependent protein [Tissierellales bacterium]MBN2827489.1 cobalamin-dependent protein [Tissierellales bacterium]
MSLLVTSNNKAWMDLAQKVFELQFARDSNIKREYDERQKRLMLMDIYYNIDYLQVAIKYDSEKMMSDYVKWLMGLLFYRMKALGLERIKAQMIMHFTILGEVIKEDVADQSFIDKSMQLINLAIDEIELFELYEHDFLSDSVHPDLAKAFFNSLLGRDRRVSAGIISEAVNSGILIEDIYTQVFVPAMTEIGNYWYQKKIGIDQEHYATAVTQTVMAQLYPKIFNMKKNGKTLIGICVGNELHEMGIRVLCDLMEVNGWDTIYLGAAVPVASVLESLDTYNPDLVLLSMTMPNYIDSCKELVDAIQSDKRFNHIKIAIGGRAVDMLKGLRETWGIDVEASSYEELISWTQKNF